MALSKGRTRRGGRAALRKAREARSSAMMPALKRRLPLVEPMDQEQVKKIDDASMAILEDVGVIFRIRKIICRLATITAYLFR